MHPCRLFRVSAPGGHDRDWSYAADTAPFYSSGLRKPGLTYLVENGGPEFDYLDCRFQV